MFRFTTDSKVKGVGRGFQTCAPVSKDDIFAGNEASRLRSRNQAVDASLNVILSAVGTIEAAKATVREARNLTPYSKRAVVDRRRVGPREDAGTTGTQDHAGTMKDVDPVLTVAVHDIVRDKRMGRLSHNQPIGCVVTDVVPYDAGIGITKHDNPLRPVTRNEVRAGGHVSRVHESNERICVLGNGDSRLSVILDGVVHDHGSSEYADCDPVHRGVADGVAVYASRSTVPHGYSYQAASNREPLYGDVSPSYQYGRLLWIRAHDCGRAAAVQADRILVYRYRHVLVTRAAHHECVSRISRGDRFLQSSGGRPIAIDTMALLPVSLSTTGLRRVGLQRRPGLNGLRQESNRPA